jgi:hypothetical protein
MCSTGVLDADPRRLPTAALGPALVEVEALLRRAQDVHAALLREFDERGAADEAGSPSTAYWLQEHTGLSERESRAAVAFARTLGRLPLLSNALAAGRVTAAHVRTLAANTRNVPADLVADSEAFLVDAAIKLDSARYGVFLRQWVAVAAPGRYEADSERRYDSRWLTLATTYDGMGSVHGMLHPEATHLLRTALDALLAGNPPDDPRTRGQQRADALIDLVELARAHDLLPAPGAHRPEVVVHATTATLTDGPHPADPTAPDAPPATLDGTGPLTPTEFARITCDATWRRLLVDAMAVPLSLGRATRGIPAGLRKFVALRDGHCRYPGCQRRAAYCDVHHIVHWTHGGHTDATNLILLCRYHHHLVHDRHHTLALHPDGRLDVTRPDGTTLTSRARGPTAVLA